jgi:hypothetical protein
MLSIPYPGNPLCLLVYCQIGVFPWNELFPDQWLWVVPLLPLDSSSQAQEALSGAFLVKLKIYFPVKQIL